MFLYQVDLFMFYYALLCLILMNAIFFGEGLLIVLNRESSDLIYSLQNNQVIPDIVTKDSKDHHQAFKGKYFVFSLRTVYDSSFLPMCIFSSLVVNTFKSGAICCSDEKALYSLTFLNLNQRSEHLGMGS